MTVSPPRTVLAGRDRQRRASRGTNTSIRDPNFISPIRAPASERVARLRRGRRRAAPARRRPAARRPSAPSWSIQISECSFRCASWRYAGTKRARHVVDARHPAGHRRAIDVHVEQRQKNRHLLPVARRRLVRRAPDPRASPCRRPARARRVGSAGGVRSGSRKNSAMAIGRTSSSDRDGTAGAADADTTAGTRGDRDERHAGAIDASRA